MKNMLNNLENYEITDAISYGTEKALTDSFLCDSAIKHGAKEFLEENEELVKSAIKYGIKEVIRELVEDGKIEFH